MPVGQAASNEGNELRSAATRRLVAILDLVVNRANQLSFWGVSYKPYWLMCDVATVLALAYAFLFSAHFPSVSSVGLVMAIVISLLAYKLVLELKKALGKSAARSFLQDCLLIIIPSFLIVSLLFKQPMNLILAFLGTLLPLYGCLARIGCFLGGCCYGTPSTIGVLYPNHIFESPCGGCRRYSPSPNPNGRVFPIQLLEATAQAMLFAILTTFTWMRRPMVDYTLWLYLSLYAMVRFLLDFFRTTSARPRRGPFSEAQCVCMGVSAISVTFLIATLVGFL
jgi:phosphatidylglycerol---prolipoprotein diacylglyceryl transferase